MKRSGTQTPDKTRKTNLMHSRRVLEAVLGNFAGTDLLVTLSYRRYPSHYSREQKLFHVRDMIRSMQRKRERYGSPLRYVYATEWRGDGTVHRVALNRMEARTPEALRALWPHGDVLVQTLEEAAQERELALIFMGHAIEAGRVDTPLKRTWSASLGLTRLERKIVQ